LVTGRVAVKRRFARLVLRLFGWRVVGQFPRYPKMMVVFAPHTSNWDFVLGLPAAAALGARVSWVGKHTMFRWPFGGPMRRLGGIPLNRDRTEGAVRDLVETFSRAQALILVMAPEGTRSCAPYWRSGFYHVALAAGVPLVLTFVDRPTRRIGVGPTVVLSGDIHRDMEALRGFYSTVQGIRPANTGEVRLQGEG
jgi:1-acyl-sn-glycerol-3-phosphate acyltransferase